MKEYNIAVKLAAVVLFVVFLCLVVYGQKTIGLAGLGKMLVGLAGLLALMWGYNRQYQ